MFIRKVEGVICSLCRYFIIEININYWAELTFIIILSNVYSEIKWNGVRQLSTISSSNNIAVFQSKHTLWWLQTGEYSAFSSFLIGILRSMTPQDWDKIGVTKCCWVYTSQDAKAVQCLNNAGTEKVECLDNAGFWWYRNSFGKHLCQRKCLL